MKKLVKFNLQISNQCEASDSKPQTCLFSQCKLKSIEGYNFCYQHVYADSNRKLKTCSYKSNETVDRCNQLILDSSENYCLYHSALKKVEKRKGKLTSVTMAAPQSDSKYKYIDTDSSKKVLNEQILTKIEEEQKVKNELSDNQDSDEDEFSEPFIPDNSDDSLTDISESEQEQEYDYALEHATVYTPEEVLKIFKVKLRRLHLMYKKQLKILDERMKYDRKVYLLMRKNEIEKYGLNYKINLRNQAQKDILRAAKRYKKYSGLRAYLKDKLEEKKTSILKSEDDTKLNSTHSQSTLKCSFTENGFKCDNKVLPLAKFCKTHILNDKNQALYTECIEQNCKELVIKSIMSNCPIHLGSAIISQLKPVKNYDDDLFENKKVSAESSFNEGQPSSSNEQKSRQSTQESENDEFDEDSGSSNTSTSSESSTESTSSSTDSESSESEDESSSVSSSSSVDSDDDDNGVKRKKLKTDTTDEPPFHADSP